MGPDQLERKLFPKPEERSTNRLLNPVCGLAWRLVFPHPDHRPTGLFK